MQTRLFKYDPDEIKKLGLIEHHIKYRELHGDDDTVWLTRSEHHKLHNRLRRKGKCKISPKELEIVSKKAHNRTHKRREYQRNYSRNNLSSISFVDNLSFNISLYQKIVFNKKTGSVYLTSFLRIHNNKKLRIGGDCWNAPKR